MLPRSGNRLGTVNVSQSGKDAPTAAAIERNVQRLLGSRYQARVRPNWMEWDGKSFRGVPGWAWTGLTLDRFSTELTGSWPGHAEIVNDLCHGEFVFWVTQIFVRNLLQESQGVGR